jgi:hypothetical protein
VPAAVGVKPVEGLYVPFPLTVAVPTVVPPVVQLVGAAAWGPKTLKVMVPVAALAPLLDPASVELIELAGMAVLVASVAGAAAVRLVAFWTTSAKAVERVEAVLPERTPLPLTVTT